MSKFKVGIDEDGNCLIEYNVYRQVIGKYCEYLSFVGSVEATDRNDACLRFRDGEYKDCFLTARAVL